MKMCEYIEDTGIPIARFAKRCNLTYPQVRHILKGNAPTLKSALRIEKYTEGKVAPIDLISERLRKEIYGDEDKEETQQEVKG